MANPITPGIYSITSKVNQKIYVGSSLNIHRRWKTHQRDLRLGRHKNPILQAHVNKYGLGALVFDVMEVEPSLTLRLGLEQLLITALLGPSCFNICKVANSHYGSRGRVVSAETRARMSASQMGRKASPEAKANMSKSQKAKDPYTQEMKMEIARKKSLSMRGKIRSDEHRARLSLALTGKTASPETRLKLSLSHKGKKKSPESIAKQVASIKAKKNKVLTKASGQ